MLHEFRTSKMPEQEEKTVKLTIRLPKKLIKDMKQTALDLDTTVTDLVEQAFANFLKERKK